MDREYLIEEKKEIIREREAFFAELLALRALEKPKLSIWMILIPIIFVYYFFQYNRFSDAKKQFVDHYMRSRVRALKEAGAALKEGRPPETEGLTPEADMPEDVRPLQKTVMEMLVEHYTALLRSEGDDHGSLVKGAYRSETELLLFFNNLNRAEHEMNAALVPHLEKTHEGVSEAIARIEKGSEELRREIASDTFKTA